MKKYLPLLLLVGWPAMASAQSESFVVRLGRDTIAIETFVRAADRLEGELSGSAVGMRTRYRLVLNNGAADSMRTEIIPADADTASMKASLQFVRDSVFVQLTRGGAAQPEQRLATQPGAVPFLNLAFSLVELITTRAQRTVGDSITAHFFVLANGATMPAKVKWNAADSAVITLGGLDLRTHLDARGRILHAVVPAQNVSVERVAGTLNRARTETPDYSAPPNAGYTAEQVTIKTPGGHVLGGTLTLPKTRRGRMPAVITITGSGPQDRDEALAGMRGYRPFRELAENLAGRGVAVLRYDDRGVGASTGVFADATSADFAQDVQAAIAWLRARPEIDPTKIFLAGHSEGGLIAPIVAAGDASLKGIILLAGPAYTGRRILEYQTRHGVDQQTGKTQAERDSLYRVSMKTIDSLSTQQPWLGFFAQHNPLPVVRKVSVPVLIVHGATDRQVTAEQAAILDRELRAAGNRDVALHVLPEVNHLFLRDPLGNAQGYASLPSRNVVPQLFKIVGDWIAEHSK